MAALIGYQSLRSGVSLQRLLPSRAFVRLSRQANVLKSQLTQFILHSWEYRSIKQMGDEGVSNEKPRTGGPAGSGIKDKKKIRRQPFLLLLQGSCRGFDRCCRLW